MIMISNKFEAGVSNHRRLDCSFAQTFVQMQIKGNIKLRATGLCGGNPPATGEFPSQRAINAENVPVWSRHHTSTNGETSYVMI